MKLKSIDINAFRLFDQEHVDFTNEQSDGSRQCANFVTIYAPNGFGKTSLFDAIEFGMTRNIHRLKIGNFKEQMKYEGKVSNFASFIHNKKKPNELVSVKLKLEDFKEKEVEEVVDPNNEKNLLLGDGHNRFFTNAILSQDWFSEFLTASTAEDRFVSFMRNFHQTGELLEYHSHLKYAQKSLGNEKGEKQRRIEQKRRELDEALDEHIIERMDNMLKTLEELGVKLNWNRKIDEQSITQLKIDTDGVESRIEAEIKKHQHVLSNCLKVKRGQDGLISLGGLEEQKKKIKKLKVQIAEKEALLAKIRQGMSLIRQLEKLEKEWKNCLNEVERLRVLIERYPKYHQQQEALITLGNTTKTYEAKIKQQYDERKRVESLLNDSDFLKVTLDKQLTGICNKLEKLDDEYSSYLALLSSITNSEKALPELEKEYRSLVVEKDEQNKRLAVLEGLQKGVADRVIQIVIEEYRVQSQEIIALQQSVKSKEKEINHLEEGIRQKTNYQDQIKELLVHARNMVEELKDGVCPLCGYDYGSMDFLLKSIEENKSISTTIEEAIVRVNKLKKEIEGEKAKIEELYKSLALLLDEDNKKVKGKIEIAETELRTLETVKAEMQRNIADSKKKIADEYSQFNGLTKEQFKAQYKLTLTNIRKKIKEQEGTLDSLKKQKSEIIKLIEQADEGLKATLGEINRITADNDYLDYKRLLGEEQAVDENTLALWKNRIDEKRKIAADYESKLKDIKEQLKKFEEEKIDLTAEISIKDDVIRLVGEEQKEESAFVKTILFIAQYCCVREITSETPSNEIMQSIVRMALRQKEILNLKEESLVSITEFRTLIVSAEKYNHQQLVRKEIAHLEEEIKGLGKDQETIREEKERLQDYLTKYVKNFFQEDLINELYNRIDPHPEYKEVKFDCDFSFNKPRLIVYMGTRKEGDVDIVPNLYFSTAQVNILSFCIFLAKAMFAKTDDGEDVGCIFIDDPIQALDDINILSMIDMLRNVAFKMKKQVILTTHDQNFFGLLQKKMPQDKFNACYLEIYERGKFRKVSAV